MEPEHAEMLEDYIDLPYQDFLISPTGAGERSEEKEEDSDDTDKTEDQPTKRGSSRCRKKTSFYGMPETDIPPSPNQNRVCTYYITSCIPTNVHTYMHTNNLKKEKKGAKKNAKGGKIKKKNKRKSDTKTSGTHKKKKGSMTCTTDVSSKNNVTAGVIDVDDFDVDDFEGKASTTTNTCVSSKNSTKTGGTDLNI